MSGATRAETRVREALRITEELQQHFRLERTSPLAAAVFRGVLDLLNQTPEPLSPEDDGQLSWLDPVPGPLAWEGERDDRRQS